MANPGPKPLDVHPSGDKFKYFLPQDPIYPIRRPQLAGWLPYFLGQDATIDSFNDDSVGFFYWAWRPLTTAMIEDIQGRHQASRPVPLHRSPDQQPPYAAPSYQSQAATQTMRSGLYSSTNPGYAAAALPTYQQPAYQQPAVPPPLTSESSEIDPADCAYDPAGNPYFHTKHGRYLEPAEVEQVKATRALREALRSRETAATSSSLSGSSTEYAFRPPVSDTSASVLSTGTYDSTPRGMQLGGMSGTEFSGQPTTIEPPPQTQSPGHWTLDEQGRRIFVRNGQILKYAD